MSVASVFLLRHSEPEGTRGGRYLGRRSNPSLTARGLELAEKMARSLAGKQFDVVLSSPLMRAVETANIVLGTRRFSIPLDLDMDLSEIDFGDFEGLNFQEAEKLFPAPTKSWIDDPESFAFPGGEAMIQFRERVERVGKKIRRLAEEKKIPVLVVAHGGSLRRLMMEWLGLPADRMWCIRLGYAGLAVIEFSGGPLGELTELIPGA